MNLDKINVTLRPRDGWQSIDLGFQMARQWFIPLATLWLCLALPIYALLMLLPLPGIAILFIWWWFKPLYEAPLLFWCSRAMFSEPVSHRQALRETLPKFTRLLSSFLSIRRLSTSRSQNMNVIMLENLKGKPRSDRIAVLNRMATRNFALISMCFHFEAILYYGLMLLGIALLPAGTNLEHSFELLLGEPTTQATIITAILIIIAGAMIAPFYVCAGFSLYINRRTQLEAWDVELDFRRIANRTRPGSTLRSNTLGVLFTLLLVVPMLPVQPVQSQTTRAESSQTIERILSADDFGSTTTKKRLRLKDQSQRQNTEDDESSNLFSGFREWFGNFAKSVEAVLWVIFVVAAIALVVAVYKNSTVLQQLATRMGWRRDPPTGSVVFDLDIRPKSLPADIPAVANDLIHQGRKRDAMSLLYRGALSRLVHNHGMEILPGETEKQCVSRVVNEQPEHRSHTFSQLTTLWQQAAYAQTQPASDYLIDICNEWQPAFDGDNHG